MHWTQPERSRYKVQYKVQGNYIWQVRKKVHAVQRSFVDTRTGMASTQPRFQQASVTTMSSPVNSDTRTPIFRPGLRHLLTLSIPPDLLRLVILLTILSYAPFTS